MKETKTKYIQVRVGPTDKDRFQFAADLDNRPLSSWLADLAIKRVRELEALTIARNHVTPQATTANPPSAHKTTTLADSHIDLGSMVRGS